MQPRAMRAHVPIAGGVLALVCGVGSANAQVIDRPPRSTQGLFGTVRPTAPNRPAQTLIVTFDALGGYEDSVSPDGRNGAPDPTAPAPGATSGTAAGMLTYQRESSTRGIEASGHGVVTAYRGVDVRPQVGGRGHMRAFGRWFNRLNLAGWSELDYRPTFMFGTFGPSIAPDTGTPPVDPTTGVTESESLNTTLGGSVAQEWTVRQRTNASHAYSRRRSYGWEALDIDDQRTVVGHSWAFVRNTSVMGAYTLSRQRAGNESVEIMPLDTQTASLGFELRVPVSRTRRMTFSGDAGATRVDTLTAEGHAPIQYTTPSGGGSVRIDLGRTWSVSSDYRREVTMLGGVTGQAFVTTTLTGWAGGQWGRSLLSFTATHTDGGQQQGDVGSFRSLGAIAQMQYRMTRRVALVANYSYYEHDMRDVSAVPLGFPSTFERNAVRVGMTFWLPLYGAFPPDRPPAR
jgi:hypothetical protein